MRRWRRLAKAGLVVLALIAGKELVSGLPDDSVTARAFEVSGAVGEDVQLRTGTVRVNDVRLASTVLTPTAGYRTPGLWVVARVSLVPGAERETLAYTAVRSEDGARRWESRSRQQEPCPATPPGVPVTCEVLIEVPPDQLVGGDLLVSTEDDLRYDSVAVIDLGIDADQLARAEEVDEPLETGGATVGTVPEDPDLENPDPGDTDPKDTGQGGADRG